ncbi:hypothetical protein NC99_29230 [Sunxiuqinia dokdonensis]|uniref:Uncharacterized protein n=1 Tax=Sunxiuqinia dokdonensis TaxID=1409788 RepID=A0A0L8V7U3_9BACT|nr:hypothetical protein NC99_29230 [Sunxiuqinia dokdonensis]
MQRIKNRPVTLMCFTTQNSLNLKKQLSVVLPTSTYQLV